MKFIVEKLPQAEAEIKSLEESQQKLLSVVFVKKTQKTPKEKIKLAKQRLKEV